MTKPMSPSRRAEIEARRVALDGYSNQTTIAVTIYVADTFDLLAENERLAKIVAATADPSDDEYRNNLISLSLKVFDNPNATETEKFLANGTLNALLFWRRSIAEVERLTEENERLKKFIMEDAVEDEDCGCDFCVKARKIVGGEDGN